ncbi:helix-turn-helix transcriptional regulator [Patescibacteria group bacterium]|nr:helix-turn-helix transcriptional regulator [Patescibacteria group bacterium]MBU4023032.1 helix-turn-helix transcriptional regulator [Patescibacteria group bacterium]
MSKIIYSKDHKNIVERLKQARVEAGLEQKQVADKLGKTQSYISKIESGQRRLDVVQLKAFARIYKKDLNFFIEI